MASKRNISYGLLLHLFMSSFLPGLFCTTEIEQRKHPRPTLAHLASKKPKTLILGSTEDSKQKKNVEELSRERNREKAHIIEVLEIEEDDEGGVLLSRKMKVGPTSD
ncbi:hypothetical protein Adt_35130 [Abeliophyllum distichum]|uniref:Uncharacterized protein n=1 Tax=Abeliophyllum distichum TaxID=126358 RepID=A0ABD1QDU8_9LAMI